MGSLSFAMAGLVLLSPWILKAVKKDTKANEAANVAITLGILLTFAGISLGLYGFNTDDIEGSIPTLLEGLKTAFFSSVVGIAISILIKIRPEVFGYKIRAHDVSGATIETLAKLLVKIDGNLTQGFGRLDKSLTGDEDGSLITQIQKLRTTTSDKLDQLNSSFHEFAEKVVADSTQQLIDALTAVINDFNNQINEQFGENFKHLNQGVEKLVVWQAEHKDQVEKLTGLFNEVSQGMSSVEKSMESVATNSKGFQETNSKLSETIDSISKGVGSFAELGEKASSSLPKIEQKVDGMTNALFDAVDKLVDDLKKQGDNLEKNQEQIRDKTINMIEDVNERIKGQFEALDEGLTSELTKALEALGNNLASLSNRFVEDYTPLTNSLREVVLLAENVNGNGRA